MCIRGDLLQELDHAVIKAEKSYHLPSATWKISKVHRTIQSKSKGLRIRVASGEVPSPG